MRLPAVPAGRRVLCPAFVSKAEEAHKLPKVEISRKKGKKVKKGVDKRGVVWYINKALERRRRGREFQGEKLKKPLDKAERVC